MSGRYFGVRLHSTMTKALKIPTVRIKASQLCHFHLGLNYLKGHSHYQNTRHIKAAKDMLKARTSAQVASQIRLAVREGGSNPKTNDALARAIKLGDELNIPAKSVQNMVQKASMSRGNSTLLGVSGPHNSVFLIEISSFENPNLKSIRREIEKAGGVLTGHAAAASNFEKKAIVVAASKNEKITLTDAETIAIECEAEDVQQVPESICEFRFSAEPDRLYSMCNSLTHSGFNIQNSGIEFVPLSTVAMSKEDKERWTIALDSLNNMDTIDIESVFDNVEW